MPWSSENTSYCHTFSLHRSAAVTRPSVSHLSNFDCPSVSSRHLIFFTDWSRGPHALLSCLTLCTFCCAFFCRPYPTWLLTLHHDLLVSPARGTFFFLLFCCRSTMIRPAFTSQFWCLTSLGYLFWISMNHELSAIARKTIASRYRQLSKCGMKSFRFDFKTTVGLPQAYILLYACTTLAFQCRLKICWSGHHRISGT